jgi:hypothetical protein
MPVRGSCAIHALPAGCLEAKAGKGLDRGAGIRV